MSTGFGEAAAEQYGLFLRVLFSFLFRIMIPWYFSKMAYQLKQNTLVFQINVFGSPSIFTLYYISPLLGQPYKIAIPNLPSHGLLKKKLSW